MKMYALLCFSILLISCFSATVTLSEAQLTQGFYGATCPLVEEIVQTVVAKSLKKNPGLGAGLIRLHFHDCFVRGCDASILLDSIDGNLTEKNNPINLSLRGYEVIDEAKATAENFCPNIVSCADIIAFAARDAAAILGGINFEVPSGRRDGVVSRFEEPFKLLPGPSSNLSVLENMFRGNGLSIDDLVILSGAHSLGVSHCDSFEARLHPRDPSLDHNFADVLTNICPATNSSNTTVPMDFTSPNVLDNAYYRNLQRHRVVFSSDEALLHSKYTKQMVNRYAFFDEDWKKDFGEAMVRLGLIEGHSGDQGQIRRNCRFMNE